MENLAVQDLSILLVEPSVTQRKIIINELREEGVLSVEGVGSAREAYSEMQRFQPDLLITAMYLPDATGPELVEILQKSEQTADIPVMVVSSEQNYDNLEAVRQSKVLALLPKPFTRQDLHRALVATIDYINPDELDLELYDIDKLRVLIVDDSRMARRHLARVLQQIGVTDITEAEDGAQARDIIEEHGFDLILTDYNMPNMDGEQLINYVRNESELSHVPILMVTSEENDARLSSVRQAGVSALCDKPFEMTQVKSLLVSLLD
ncbi:response regulator [Oceanospirillum sediminis]|uniref:Response regulator n=1 Tax=Oceanospirillum sediminis TaxID=2760088 RepID=A0A839ITB3_9GAMM|nr:response regulator [Oceanospirillum sediminis]MBB1487894.1 response regulator [Oceanospirillum sediminis]